MMKCGLSIVIVNYYCEQFIIKLVDSILSNININYEIIIVNNSPYTFSWSNDFLVKNHIMLLPYKNNDGFGIAINRGVKFSNYSYFCMLNPDIILEKNTLNQLYNYFESLEDKSIGAISCLILNQDGTYQKSFFMDKQRSKKDFTLNLIRDFFPSKIRRYLFRTNYNSKSNLIDFQVPFEVGGFYGSFIMLKKSCFQEVGGFDPDFFMYSEDTDFFRNRFSKKYKSYLYPFVSLIHLVGGTDGSALMHKQAQVSFLLNLRKTGNYFLFIFIFILGFKYTLLLLHSLVKKRNDTTEAIDFFKNLKYVYRILKYPRGYHTLPKALKIDEFKETKK